MPSLWLVFVKELIVHFVIAYGKISLDLLLLPLPDGEEARNFSFAAFFERFVAILGLLTGVVHQLRDLVPPKLGSWF